MTREEAMEIVRLYRNWNIGQKSDSLVWHGERSPEDDILDARRAMIKKAYETLSEPVQKGEQI